jgi:hypothetical protein
MSIKKKFATAVATASLLAGLFGSAFVPSALAAGQSGSAGVPKANRTTVDPDASVFTTFATSKYSFTSYGNNATTGTTADSSIGFDINYANAAGTSVAITKLESLKAVSSNAAILVSWGYAEENVLGTPGSDDAGYAQPMDYDSDGDFESPEWDCADIDDTTEGATNGDAGYYSTTSTVTYVADNENFSDGQYNLCITAADEDSAGTGTITVTANGVVVKTITVTAVGPLASLELSIAGGYQYVAEDHAAAADDQVGAEQVAQRRRLVDDEQQRGAAVSAQGKRPRPDRVVHADRDAIGDEGGIVRRESAEVQHLKLAIALGAATDGKALHDEAEPGGRDTRRHPRRRHAVQDMAR